MARFDDVLQMIGDEQERLAVKAAIEKNPKAKEALQRVEGLAADGETFVKWNQESGTENRKRFDAFPKLTADLQAAQRTIEELKAGKPGEGKGEEVDLGDMTMEQIENQMLARMRKEGFVTTSEAQRMADAAATTAAAAAQGRVYTHGLPMVERMMQVQGKFRGDFGKEMDRAAFGKFIEENKFTDVDKAYEAFTRDQYVDKIKADAFAAGEAEGTKKTAERLGKENAEMAMRGLPTDMNGSNGFTSRPGAAPESVDLKDIPADYQLGQRGGFKLSHAIAAKIEADRAAGKLQQ